MSGAISLVVEEPGWKRSGVALSRVQAAARLALARGRDQLAGKPLAGGAPQTGGRGQLRVAILLANDQRLRALNAQFRGMDKSTNVLSFPAAANCCGYLGDVAVALGVATREASRTGKDLEDHTLHLVVHGVLHVLGYDHVRAREAGTMERLEAAILSTFGIADPYESAKARR